MRYFCPNCWQEISVESLFCPVCGVEVSQADALPFPEKLRRALKHPEPKTAVRAAWILGEHHERSAVADLIGVLETTRVLYVAEATAEALGKIGDDGARTALEREGAVRVRRAAKKALEQLEKATSDPPPATKPGP